MEKPPTSFHQIGNKSLRERILTTLREAILNGELRPGHTLVETELASQLGVSRAPLREAIQILNTEGLLDTVPYHGTTVKALTKRDIEELYSLRIVLETFAIRRIIAQLPEVDTAPLRTLFEQMLIAADQDDITRVNVLDREFHDTLIAMSGHKLLVSTWSSVAMRVRQVMSLRNLRNSDIKQIAHNHIPLIEAIERGDEPTATMLIAQHVASAGDLLAEDWQDDPSTATEEDQP
ncbi:MAG: GntR family transcriptional regulator [Chloroflexi bacterium]|nr:GntR family transcriptional regulator [Chloroflexota bacterium]